MDVVLFVIGQLDTKNHKENNESYEKKLYKTYKAFKNSHLYFL